MARVNALFATSVGPRNSENFDIAFSSGGRLSSIRFSLYEFLVGGNLSEKQRIQTIKLRLLSWCGILGYSSAQEALMRYSEEAKKLEETCLEALHLMQPPSPYSMQEGHYPSAPPVPNPLLKGMPGRELSASKTDGAAFAGDIDAPQILAYPMDLSRQLFSEHPLAKELELTSREKATLGLLIPEEIKSREF